ncbi:MAG: hypothetical protein QOG03_378 [Actinomycetota bacterium]|jgi:hypothetical protein|nr:hypothetical protein [Actinomycetota bacterium]
MPAWSVLLVPATLAMLFGMLMLTVYAENHLLSPRSMILHVAKARKGRPEHAEQLVAREFERLLRDSQR